MRGQDEPNPGGEIVIYRAGDSGNRIRVLLEGETVWLTQAQIAELYQTTPQNVTQHLKAIYSEGELWETTTCKDFLQVRHEGNRKVSLRLRHFSLESILAVGYRVRSTRGTQFRQRADADRANMGLTNWKGGEVLKRDVRTAKNYLGAEEIDTLNRITVMFLD